MVVFVLCEFLGRRSFIDPICCSSCMVLPMFLRLVLANSLFSLRDINLTLGLLPFIRVFSGCFAILTSPKRAKQLSMATIPLCFEFFRCRVDVLQS